MAQLVRRYAPGFTTVQLQHADVEVGLPGGIFTNVSEISYNAKVINRVEYRGVAPVAGGVTRGGLQYSASMTIQRALRFEFQTLALSDPSSRAVFDTYFPIKVSFNHPQWDRVETDTLYVMIEEWDWTSSAGASVQMLKIPLYCARIIFSSGGRNAQPFNATSSAVSDAYRGVPNQEQTPLFVIDVDNPEAL